MFSLQVLDKHNNLIGADELENKLADIMKQADSRIPSKALESESDGVDAGGVGLLTTLDRDSWASQRAALSALNSSVLESVDSAVMVLCLDSSQQNSLEDSARNMLHADGRNRWFDKFQVIVEASGRAGINMEHAPADGHSALRLATDVYNDLNGTKPIPLTEHEPSLDLGNVEALNWRVTAATQRAITAADATFRNLVDTTDTSVLELQDFGREKLKALGFSPDAFVQMAYQLAYFRLNGKFVSTYESANTKQFLCGRTETIRSASPEAAAFCRAFEAQQAPEAVRSLLKTATETHSKHSLDCKNGRGVDRHLFGLRMLAKHQQQRIAGYHIPAIFLDPSYATFTSNILSTSNCGGDAMQLFGFGPVHPKGYGLGHMIKPNSLQITVTSFNKGKSPVMAQAITGALKDMATLPK
jgi:carnitine O-acetyltransferase